MSPTIMIVISTSIVLIFAGMFSVYMGRRSKTGEDWAVGGRSLPTYVIVGTQYATAMGGGMLVAHVGIGYKSGWSVLSYGLCITGGLLILTFIAEWLRKENFTTVPEILERLYGKNNTLLSLAVLASIIVPFGWICTQLVAFGKLYSSLTGFSMTALVIVFAIVSLAFVLPAGLTSVAWTDFIFGCIMFAMTIISLIFVMNMGGGFTNIMESVPKEISSFPGGMKSVGGFTILLWALAIIPGSLTNQMYYQRIYAVDNVKNVKKTLVISAIIILSAEFWASFMGISIRAMNPNLAPEMAAGWFLTQIPPLAMAIYSGFLCATIISTTDSAVQSIVVNLTTDIYSKLIVKGKPDGKKMVKISRILSVVVTAVAVILALTFPYALKWLVATYAYSASALLCPIFVGYFMKNKNFLTAQGAIGSMFCGALGCFIGTKLSSPIPYVAFGLAGSFLGLIIISALTRSEKTLDAVSEEKEL